MTLQPTFGGVLAIALVAGVAGVAIWKRKELAAAVDAVNPASENNLVNQAAGSVVKELTGGAAAGGEDSVGGVLARFREWVSGDDARIREMLKGTPAKAKAPPPASSARERPEDVIDPYYGNPFAYGA